MTAPRPDLLGRGRSAFRALLERTRQLGRRLGRGKSGIAAVEFALILPMMLALYFGCVVLSQGLEVGRKTQLLSKTLADLTAQTLTGTYTDGGCAAVTTVPCVTDADLSNIFGASSAVLYPFAGSPTMTISEVIFDNKNNTSGVCCDAKVVWSVGYGSSSTQRACQTLTPSANGVNGGSNLPSSLYPGGGQYLGGTTGAATVDTYLIVADVTYTYNPSFGFPNYIWNKDANSGGGYPITVTTYMTPRNGAASAASPLPAIQWVKGTTFTKYASCVAGTDYNVP